MQPVWILRIDEIGLKSSPVRRMFTGVMLRTLTAHCRARGVTPTIDQGHRLLVARLDAQTDSDDGDESLLSLADIEAFEDAAAHTFGLAAVDRSIPTAREPAAVMALLNQMEWPDSSVTTFGIRAKRHGRGRGWKSQPFAAELGSLVLDSHPHLKVNLTTPDAWVHVALLPEAAHLIESRIVCPGGLPCGVQGRVSASLDSDDALLAAWLCMRRGCRIDLAEPIDSELAEILTRWDPALGNEEMIRSIGVGPHREPVEVVWGKIEIDSPPHSNEAQTTYRSTEITDDNEVSNAEARENTMALKSDEKVGLTNQQDIELDGDELTRQRVPVATLDPIAGWGEEEKAAAIALIKA